MEPLGMSYVPRPSPCYLDLMMPLGVVSGRKLWKHPTEKLFYQWDELHGEIEVYNTRGRHVGVLDGTTGQQIKPAVKGRRIDV